MVHDDLAGRRERQDPVGQGFDLFRSVVLRIR